MTFWEEAFAEKDIFLRNFSIDMQTGEFVAVPFDCKTQRENAETAYLAVVALDEFFGYFGLELRDVVTRESQRPDPLKSLIEISGQLATLDPVTPLSEALTQEVEDDLHRLAYADCKTRARAEAERIYHNGLYVNTVVTLWPCAGAEPFQQHSTNKEGTCHEPIQQKDGSYRFALTRPFAQINGYSPQDEADAAAWQVGAVLMEYTLKE